MKYKKIIMPITMAAMATIGYFGGYETAKHRSAAPIKGRYFAIAPEEFTNIYDSSLRVDRSSTLEEKCKDSTTVNHFGSGVLLRDSQTGDEYILTANHMTPYAPGEDCACNEEKEGKRSERRIKVFESHVTVEELPAVVVKQDKKADQALLKIEGQVKVKIDGQVKDATPYFGKIASQLHPGNYVLGVGFPDGKHSYSIANVESQRKYMTLLNMKLIGGNSGGGVYRFGDKGLELVGTVRGGTAITPLEKMRELIQGTPLEDDYL
ncbi:MAG: trypsin-like peptidase domain-containing protein [Nanoarchaeota archaeon]|nr:trypsin-like peptidase domain-containing protein [Nanoarchaeota archaeon]